MNVMQRKEKTKMKRISKAKLMGRKYVNVKYQFYKNVQDTILPILSFILCTLNSNRESLCLTHALNKTELTLENLFYSLVPGCLVAFPSLVKLIVIFYLFIYILSSFFM